ncbi:MAG: hypothetical protein IJI25_05435 [Eubacterium sp.]|nr:hypothetical protein [Eubacterium sp.]
MLTMKIAFIISGIFVIFGTGQCIMLRFRLNQSGKILDFVSEASERERELHAKEEREKMRQAEIQSKRCFGLDFLITHGSAFGGCSGTCPDGKPRKGQVPLDQVMMYGRQPSGRDYTYYIEDQGLSICAADEEDRLLVRSDDQPFEIREAGLGRDQGRVTMSAFIMKDILYYIILESHHEISIRATGKC